MRSQNFDDKFWKDKNGRVVVWQKPNKVIIAWAVLSFIALWLPTGSFVRTLSYIGDVLLIVWALMELISGANGFRRLLGFTVLLMAAMVAFIV